MPDIRQWADIADDFTDTIIVGNGGSMAVSAMFSYRTLLEKARAEALVTADVEKVFDYFETEDFELVLRMLWDTYHVNAALGISDKVTTGAYHAVRTALIKAVRATHPDHEAVAADIQRIGSFMTGFQTVLSLNYDLIVYWSMLSENENRGRWFKDAFLHGDFDTEWERLRDPYGGKGSTLVFYPHGNLVLGTRVDRAEVKISRSSSWTDLLDTIFEAWESERLVPLFVSEGNRKQKEQAIMRSHYLSTVYQAVLPKVGRNVAIYGWGMASQDSHILRQFRVAGVRRFAVSVFTGRDPDDVAEDCEKTQRRLRKWVPGCGVTFFDSASPGCWNKA